MTAGELRAKARERIAEIAAERRRLDAEEVDLRRMLGESSAPVVPFVPPSIPFPLYPQPIAPDYPSPIWIIPRGPGVWPFGNEIICSASETFS